MINIQTNDTNFDETRDFADNFFKNCTDFIEGINYEYQFVLDEDIYEGINKAYVNNDADLLIMMKHSYSIIDLLFRKDIAKAIVSDAKVPLLIIN